MQGTQADNQNENSGAKAPFTLVDLTAPIDPAVVLPQAAPPAPLMRRFGPTVYNWTGQPLHTVYDNVKTLFAIGHLTFDGETKQLSGFDTVGPASTLRRQVIVTAEVAAALQYVPGLAARHGIERAFVAVAAGVKEPTPREELTAHLRQRLGAASPDAQLGGAPNQQPTLFEFKEVGLAPATFAGTAQRLWDRIRVRGLKANCATVCLGAGALLFVCSLSQTQLLGAGLGLGGYLLGGCSGLL